MTEKRLPRPAYRVETDRLIIRCWDPADAPLLRAAIDEADAYLRPWIPWMKAEPRSLDETVQWVRAMRARFDGDEDYRYGIFERDEGALAGETGLYARVGEGAREIGYWIRRDRAGRGFATEAAAAMVRLAFEHDAVNRVEIHCSPLNAASAAVPAKLGFSHEATLRRRFENADGEMQDSMIWTLFASDYPRSAARLVRISAFDCLGERVL